jgi:hypothetical protein
MQAMPFIPEFNNYKERNKWIVDNAQYFTIILKKDRKYLRSERHTFDEAVALANQVLDQYPHARLMVYAVAGGHETLTATVSTDRIKRHD